MLIKYISNLINKNLFKDFTLSILASIIGTFVIQMIAYPYLSRIMSSEEYGLLLTTIGIINTVGVSLGNSLNNTRILMQKEYEDNKLNGDYNLLFISAIVIGSIIITIITLLVYEELNITIIGCIITSALLLFRSYHSVSFRIFIDYRKNLICSVYGAIGCLVGLITTYFTGIWILTFILSELFSCIYIVFKAETVKEGFNKTKILKRSINKYIYILSAAILSTVMMYMDRFFIFPILGSEKVAIYNVASFLGKTLGIVMIPISGVLLTYYAKESKLTLKRFYSRISIFTIISSVFYIVILVIGIPISRILYPTLIEESTPYFAIANLAAIIFILGNTIQPTLLRFCSAKWQPILQIIYLLLYLLLGYLGMDMWGLIGFCYAVLISNLIKIILMLVIVTITLYKRNEGEF